MTASGMPLASARMRYGPVLRTPTGAEAFAAVRSYIETGRKHANNPLELLAALFAGTPWAIPPPTP